MKTLRISFIGLSILPWLISLMTLNKFPAPGREQP